MPAYIVTIGLIISVVLLLIIMLVVLVSYHTMVKKFRFAQRENTFLKNHLHERSVEVLDSARTKALALLEEAEKKAQEIISSSESFQGQSQTETKELLKHVEDEQSQLLQNATTTLIGTYTSALQKTEQNDTNVLATLTTQFEKQAESSLKNTEALLQKEAGTTEQLMQTMLTQLQANAEKDIAIYKAERLQKVDERILEMLNTVAKDVFGTTLPLDEHEQIVMDALEAAKKDLVKN